jgi:hypothetical protein
MRWWHCVALLLGCACSSSDREHADPVRRPTPSEDAGPSKVTYAIVKVTRTLVDDEHPSAGGALPRIDVETMRVVLDYGGRSPQTQPVIRTYSVTIAVPSDRPRSWDVELGDDYDLLIATRGFVSDAGAVDIDGRAKSSYQVQLHEGKAPIGPNSVAFTPLAVGARAAIQVMNDEAEGRVFREFEEIELAELTAAEPKLPEPGIDESAEAQKRRWDEWVSIRKAGLR